MDSPPRLALIVLEVADLDASAALYEKGFAIPLHTNDNGGDDRWISGIHAEYSWRDGAYLHFALYQAKGTEVTTPAQVGFMVADVDSAHECAVAAGALVIHPPRPEPWGATARYRDLDGNVVSLTEG